MPRTCETAWDPFHSERACGKPATHVVYTREKLSLVMSVCTECARYIHDKMREDYMVVKITLDLRDVKGGPT
jgi:hypothetical protein